MNAALDVKMYSDDLLMAVGVKFGPVEWSELPQPDDTATGVLDRALDEMVSNALAIRTAAGLNGVLGLAAFARQAIRLRAFVDEALASPQTSLYNEDGWQVHLIITAHGEIDQVELYRRAVTLSERFQ